MHPLNPAPLLDKKTPASANKTIKNKKTFLNFHDDKPVSILKSSGKPDDLNYINVNNDSNNDSNNDLMKKLYTQNNEIINKTIFTSNDNNSNSNANANANANANVNIDIDHPKPFIEPRNIEETKDFRLKYSYKDNYPEEFPSKYFQQQSFNDHNMNNMNNMNIMNNQENVELLNKLDYLINLLEEQKGQKTTYVAEELILYTFLGIFIIFVLDNFTKFARTVAPTKYTR